MKVLLNKFAKILLISFFLISCLNDKKIKIEVTSNKERLERIEKIRKNISEYILSNSEKSIIKSYFHIINNKGKSLILYDQSFFVGFLKDSIMISNLRSVQISPIPLSYDLKKGKKGDYNVTDKLNRKLNSFILNFDINEKQEIDDCWLLIFFKGDDYNPSIKKEIFINEFYDYKNELIIPISNNTD